MEGVPISDLCDELGLQPTVFYRWQKEFFENGAAAFQQKGRPNHSAEQERIAHLERKIQTKDEAIRTKRRNAPPRRPPSRCLATSARAAVNRDRRRF